MIFAELPGRIALRLEDGGQGNGLVRQADVGAGLADGGEPGTQRDLAGDEIGAPRRTAGFGVVVGEHHPVGGELVEVRRLARHHAAMIGADVEPADIVAHDDDDVRLVRRRGDAWRADNGCGRRHQHRGAEQLFR